MNVTLTLNRVLVLVVVILSLPLLFDLSKLPDSVDAQEYVFAALTPCNEPRVCSLCGEVLEMVDLVQRALIDPFTDELTLSAADWDLQSLRSYQRCVREPVQRGCDTLVHKVKTQRIEFAKLILQQVLEEVSFRNKWGLLGEDYIVSNAMRLTNYIFEAQERTLSGLRDPQREEGAAHSIVYQQSTLSLSGDPEVESLVTQVWFLRRDVQHPHQEFCYPVCEGKLGFLGRLRLAFAKFYIHHSVKPRLLLLRQFHRGTLVLTELLMIGLVICVERVMRPAPQWNDVVLATSDGRRQVRASEAHGGGVLGAGRGGDGGSSSNGGGAGGGGLGHTSAPPPSSGKGDYRQGRRR